MLFIKEMQREENELKIVNIYISITVCKNVVSQNILNVTKPVVNEGFFLALQEGFLSQKPTDK